MLVVDIQEAQAHLSRLVDRAAKGEPFVIARSGKPMVKVVPFDAPVAGKTRRIGFLEGQIAVPEDFDRMGADEIAQLFGGALSGCSVRRARALPLRHRAPDDTLRDHPTEEDTRCQH
jgi:prevent-host-death family protein